jgi:prepilin-type processing-associated H-X9-DG protein
MLLPYLEQAPLYAAANFSWGIDPYGDPCYYINSTVANTRLNIFICPSDAYAGKTNINSYYGSVGTTSDFMTADCWGGVNPNCRPTGSTGTFTYFETYSISAFTDGTSNTVAYSEGLAGRANNNGYRGNSTRGVSDPGTVVYDITVNPALAIEGLNRCNVAFKANQYISTNKGQLWAFGARAYTLFQTIQVPNDQQYTFGSCQFGCQDCGLDQSWSVGASSNHSGGCNVLFVDGSVKFIKSSIDRKTWWSLGTRDRNEAVSADAF